MSKSYSKSTKRFNFSVNRNSTSHAAGSNTVTIETRSDDEYYSTPTVGLTMSVKEAKALSRFLDKTLNTAPAIKAPVIAK
jgi:hypothetical protein